MSRLLLAALLCLPSLALAQTGTTMAQTCSGDMLMSTIGLQIFQNGADSTIQPGSTSIAFANAECYCETTDFKFQLRATQQFAQGSHPNAQIEFWLGTNCENVMTRTSSTQTTCEKLNVTVPISKLTQFGTGADTDLTVVIPSASLMSPAPVGGTGSGEHTCRASNPQSKIYLFIYETVDAPIVSCTLQTNGIVTNFPESPRNLAGSGSDQAVTLRWSTPAAGASVFPYSYQVLCADKDNNPIIASPPANFYTVCHPDGNIRRKQLVTNSTGIATDGGTTTDDGGTTSVDLGTSSTQSALSGGGVPEPAEPLADEDGGTDGGANADLGTAGNPGVSVFNLPAPFTYLDPAYICSSELRATGGDGEFRVTGLNNNEEYKFVVVAIDNYGNPIPSEVLTAIPTPVEDLYTRYYNQGGRASGFCFIATAAYGSYEHRYVRVLRDFRDRILLPTSLGSAFVDWYYAHSPPLAEYIRTHEAARILTQMALWPVIAVAAIIVYPSTLWQLAALAAMSAWFVLRRRRAKRLAVAEVAA